jgi:hypothetical protein
MKRLLFAPFLLLFAALSAVATTLISKEVPGAEKRSVTRHTFDNSYPTGGEAVNLELERVTFAQCEVVKGTESAVLRVANADYDKATGKLKLFDNATGKELANASDASKVVVQVVAYGS